MTEFRLMNVSHLQAWPIKFSPMRWSVSVLIAGWMERTLGYRILEMGGAQVLESLCGSMSIKQLHWIVRRTRNKLVLSWGLGVFVTALSLSVLSVCTQSCLTLCGLPGSSVHGIFFQARILDPPPGVLPDPGIETTSLTSPALQVKPSRKPQLPWLILIQGDTANR